MSDARTDRQMKALRDTLVASLRRRPPKARKTGKTVSEEGRAALERGDSEEFAAFLDRLMEGQS